MSSQTHPQHSASCRCHQADHGAAGQDLDEVEFQRSACNAALVGDVEKLEAILDRHPEQLHEDGRRPATRCELHPATSSGYSPLIYASRAGHVGAVKLLLRRGANVDRQTTEMGSTALHRAAVAGHAAVVRLLLDAGADVSIRDCDGLTALERVARQRSGMSMVGVGRPEVVALLEQAGKRASNSDGHRARSGHDRTPHHSSSSTQEKVSDPFGLLGVAPGASTAEIKAAFRRRALECHPDIVATAPPAVQAAKAAEYASVVEAYERLTTRGAASSSATATRSQQQYSHTSSAYYRADMGQGRYRTTATASAKQSFSNVARNSWQNGGLIVLGGVFFVGLMVCEPFIDAWWESRNEGKLFKHVAAERKRCR